MAEATESIGACRDHPGREAVAHCRRCGRRACLACAVPVRGRVLCRECAASEVRVRVPEEPPAPRRSSRDVLVAVLFALGLATTALPWDRFGTRTTSFSAWSGSPDVWPLAAGLLLGLVTLVAALPLIGIEIARPHRARIAITILGTGAAIAAAFAAFAEPPAVTRSLAPYGALLLAVAATGLTATRRPAV